MNIKLHDEKILNFKDFQLTILNSINRRYLIACILVMVVANLLIIFSITFIHSREISLNDYLAMLIIFPTPILLPCLLNFYSFTNHKKSFVTFENGAILFKNEVYTHDKLWFIEKLGTGVVNLQMKGVKNLRFISRDQKRSDLIIQQIKNIRPNIEIRIHMMGK